MKWERRFIRCARARRDRRAPPILPAAAQLRVFEARPAAPRRDRARHVRDTGVRRPEANRPRWTPAQPSVPLTAIRTPQSWNRATNCVAPWTGTDAGQAQRKAAVELRRRLSRAKPAASAALGARVW